MAVSAKMQHPCCPCRPASCIAVPSSTSAAAQRIARVASRGQVALSAVGSTGTIQARHAHTRVWRPHVDDVDRLSRGEAAKIRGTGCRDIPHRLNIEEHDVFKAAKKKGYLAVRGTGYRRERKGNPLPNAFRQWCDARACPCIVIEQDVFGGPVDQVVVDLSTLRIIDPDSYAQARHTCTEVAASLAVRQLEASERDGTSVPFNILPLVSEGRSTLESWGPGVRQIKGVPQNVVLPPPSNGARRGASNASGSSNGSSSSSGSSTDAIAQADVQNVPQQQSAQREQPRQAGSGVTLEQLEGRAAKLQSDLEQQAAAVRALKEVEGKNNADVEVQAQVQALLQLKAEAAAAHQAVLDARDEAAVKQLQGTSARRAALYDAFEDVPPAASATVQQQEGDESETDGPAQQDQTLDLRAATASAADVQDGASAAGGDDGAGHPYCRAAIWQLHADPMFFEADRATAKQFAKRVVEELCL